MKQKQKCEQKCAEKPSRFFRNANTKAAADSKVDDMNNGTSAGTNIAVMI